MYGNPRPVERFSKVIDQLDLADLKPHAHAADTGSDGYNDGDGAIDLDDDVEQSPFVQTA
jgi:hypothetical protein